MKKGAKRKAQRQLGKSKSKNLNDNSLVSQRQRLLTWLIEKPITTIEGRHQLNILAVSARIFELRHKERHNILTYWTVDFTPEGQKHRVARYVLLSKKSGDRAGE